MVELRIAYTGGNAEAKLYPDFGDGLSEDLAVALPLANSRLIKRLVYWPHRPRRLRFDPLDRDGEFRIEHFRIARVPGFFAASRLLRRLASKHPEYRNHRPRDIRAQLRAEARQRDGDWLRHALDAYAATFRRDAERPSYEDWIAKYEAPEFGDADQLRARAAALHARPLITVLLPTWNTPERWLRACLDSVLAQAYPHWELCIADDASTEPHVRRVLEEYAARDARIRIVYRERNGHISAASNSALALATGEFVALLDHDDELAPHALLCVAEAVQAHPDAAVIYSDEDKLDEHGRRYDPHFKPDWNPDLLYSQNYISHLGVYRTEWVRHVGGFREGYEGSQDYDLVLRCTAGLDPSRIVHIPQVLYHWRALAGSTAARIGEKDYASAAGLRALRDHIEHENPNATVEPGPYPTTYRVRWPIPAPAPLVSLIISTRDGHDLLKKCVDSILERTTYRNFEILIIDNQSICESTLKLLRYYETSPNIRVLSYDAPFNYSAINNFAVTQARGKLIGLINNDIEVITPDWLTEMVTHAIRPEIGCVGAKLYYSDGSIQHAGVVLGIGGVAGHAHKHLAGDAPGYFSRLALTQNLSAVTAAVLVVRRETFEAVGGLDAEHLTIAFNDVDFCLKVQQRRLRNLWNPYAQLYHHESKTRGSDSTSERQRRFKAEIGTMRSRWSNLLDRDPAYSPHLSLTHEDFSLRA